MTNPEDEFTRLTAPHLGDMRKVALRFMRHADEADDVVQIALIRAWKNYGRRDPEKSFGGLLIRITQRIALDALRKKRREVHTVRMPEQMFEHQLGFSVIALVDEDDEGDESEDCYRRTCSHCNTYAITTADVVITEKPNPA